MTRASPGTSYELDPECALPPHLLRLFLRSAPGQLQELVNACDARDFEAARAQAHKLKGGLYAAGARRLADDVEALRTALKASAWPAVLQHLSLIRREFARLLGELGRRLSEGGA